MKTINLEYTRRPSLFPIYIGALPVRRKGLKPGEIFPLITTRMRSGEIDINHLNKFLKFFDTNENSPIPISYPLTLIFPLHLPILGHKEFPLLYVRMMQIRNHIIQHRPLERTDIIDINCRILTQRRASKGIELDVLSIISVDEKPVWENLNTYFFPGRFGNPNEPSPLSKILPLPEKHEDHIFSISSTGGFKFGLLSGDYNGIHYYSRYARWMGFERSFAQSYMSLTKCLMHIPDFESKNPLKLDVAYKGPVYYDRPLTMKNSKINNGFRFDLYCEGNDRPSVVGSVYEMKRNMQQHF